MLILDIGYRRQIDQWLRTCRQQILQAIRVRVDCSRQIPLNHPLFPSVVGARRAPSLDSGQKLIRRLFRDETKSWKHRFSPSGRYDVHLASKHKQNWVVSMSPKIKAPAHTPYKNQEFDRYEPPKSGLLVIMFWVKKTFYFFYFLETIPIHTVFRLMHLQCSLCV